MSVRSVSWEILYPAMVMGRFKKMFAVLLTDYGYYIARLETPLDEGILDHDVDWRVKLFDNKGNVIYDTPICEVRKNILAYYKQNLFDEDDPFLYLLINFKYQSKIDVKLDNLMKFSGNWSSLPDYVFVI